jgi:D-alanyl-D-alanine carboxypeptidase
MLTSRRISSAYGKPHTCWQHHDAFTGGVSNREQARTAVRRARSTVLAALVVSSTALIAVLGHQSSTPTLSSTASSWSTAAPTVTVRLSEQRGAPPSTTASSGDIPPGEPGGLRHESRGALGEADGVVPDGTTVFDDDSPAVANLDPDLLGALRHAATHAAGDGIEFIVNSGWRSPEYQEQLLREAISEYGSEEAARWVAAPDTSAHVSGGAVDIGPDAMVWLSEHGAAYGLCQIYSNELWHYELRPDAIYDGCPPMYSDPTDDPRMQR